MLMSILNQVGTNPSQPTPETASYTHQQPVQPNSNVAALMQQHGVKLINPEGQDPRLRKGGGNPDPRQPSNDQRQIHQSGGTMETPQLAGDGGLEVSNQMLSLLQRFTG